MTVHVIRLRGHWTRIELSDGRVRYVRHFGRPRTLDPNETVWLTGSHPPGSGTALLNDHPVGELRANDPFAFDVTARLAPRNAIVFEVGADPVEWAADVALEIKGDDHLFRE